MLAKRFEEEQQWEKALHYWLKIVYVIDPLRYPDRLNMHRVENLMSLSQLEAYVPTPCLKSRTDCHVTYSRISQTSETDSTVKATFHGIEPSMLVVCTRGNMTPILIHKSKSFSGATQSQHPTQRRRSG